MAGKLAQPLDQVKLIHSFIDRYNRIVNAAGEAIMSRSASQGDQVNQYVTTITTYFIDVETNINNPSISVETKNILGQIIRIEDKIGSVSYYEYDLFWFFYMMFNDGQ